MSWAFRVLLALVVLAMISLQHFGLEQEPEKQAETQYARLSDLPAGEMVPAYIATLFFGSFRVIAIDILWVQLKGAEEERRWVRAREITQLISHLQPRNEEVWQFLSWNTMYNIPLSAGSDEEKWKWIREGLLMAREGCRRNPRSPYLLSQMAERLKHFPTRFGRIEMDICQRIEQDDELQRALQDVPAVKERKSPFELALRWYEKAIAALQDRKRSPEFAHYRTPMGLYLYADSWDGLIRESAFLQGIYLWRQATTPDSPHLDRAKEWFLRAQAHVRELIRLYPHKEILPRYERLYGGMPPIIDRYRDWLRDPGDRPRRELLVAGETVLLSAHQEDEGYLHDLITQHKRHLSRELLPDGKSFVDEGEWNDSLSYAPVIRKDQHLKGNLKPGPGDVDLFQFPLRRDEGGDAAKEGNFLRKVTFRITHVFHPIRIRLFRLEKVQDSSTEKVMYDGQADREGHFSVTLDRPADYYVEVRALDPAVALPADTRYGISLTRIE